MANLLSDLEEPILETMRTLRKLSDDERAKTTKTLALRMDFSSEKLL